MIVGRVYPAYLKQEAPMMTMEALLELKERQLEKARQALMMCIAPDPEAERLKEEVLLEQ
jgi:hypothetical protein